MRDYVGEYGEVPKGSRWEFHNVTTGEIRTYEVSRTERGGLIWLRRLEGPSDAFAKVWALTLFRSGNGGSRSHWLRVA